MEYLMTYGWAILIIIVVVAALYAMGVFNIKGGVTCSPCFSYFAFVDYAGGTIRMRNGARTISFDSAGGDVTFNPAGGTETDLNADGVLDCCVGAACAGGDDPCNAGRDIEFTGITSTSGTDVTITINYVDRSSNLQHTDTATLHNK
jgi:hypothetical protein